MWWWAVVRLAVTSDAGVLEGAVAAGGWGLSLLPVHCVAKARAAGALAGGRWRSAWRAVRREGRRRPGGGGGAAGGSASGPERGRGRQGC
ncbi:hypothetical protein [Streptomyces sp. 3214.6]|uniref:hypothetical protein n=1 Tax=Streptomyces sp. 3214.6 TaxID=1882757 RepID=UPI000C1AE8E8|nr:hypothetical protein [Streptomyces sp. 3214.6]